MGDATRAEKTGSAGGRKKLTEFNKFMQTEVARLKQENPDMPHKDRCGTSAISRVSWARGTYGRTGYRFKLVIDNWNKQKESK